MKKYNFLPKEKEETIQLGVFVPREMFDRIVKIAKKNDVSKTTVVKGILSVGLLEIENENSIS